MRPKHPLAGKTVTVHAPGAAELDGKDYRIEDWWENVAGMPWGMAQGNPACLKYACRIGFSDKGPPPDEEVVYGKIAGFGHLIHVTELGEVKETL